MSITNLIKAVPVDIAERASTGTLTSEDIAALRDLEAACEEAQSLSINLTEFFADYTLLAQDNEPEERAWLTLSCILEATGNLFLETDMLRQNAAFHMRRNSEEKQKP